MTLQPCWFVSCVRHAALLTVCTALSTTALAAERTILASNLPSPESVAVTSDGRIFVSLIGKMTAKGDGAIALVESGKAKPIATGLDDPAGLAVRDDELFVADKTKIWKIGRDGKAEVYLDAEAFPVKPRLLNDLVVGPGGDLFASDSGNFTSAGAVFRISPTRQISVVTSNPAVPDLKAPNGILSDGPDHLLLNDFVARRLWRVTIADGSVQQVAEDLGGADGLARDKRGRVYVTDWGKGRILVLDNLSSKPRVLFDDFKGPADLTVDPYQDRLLIPDMKAGTLTAAPLSE